MTPTEPTPDVRRVTGRLAVIVGIALATFACFAPALSRQKEFTNWDDPGYVTDQPLVRSLAPDNLRRMLDPRSDVVMLNYHPLTVLSLAIDYRLAGLDVRAYAATNVAIHVLTSLAVLAFVRALPGVGFPAAALTALWFAIHPMHVESVAWIPGRKDVLYGLFFFASCTAYVRYLRTSRLRWLASSFALFALSCLSKGTAVTLPVVLLLLDWLHHRRPSAGLVVEKLPFVALALWIGWVAVRLQATVPMADFVVFTPAQRLALAAYGFVRYCEKLFVPYRLSAFYPYPEFDAAHHLPRIYAALPVLALLLVALPLWLAARRGHRPGTLRLAAFAVAFFTIALVLQFISFGTAIMADRYTYVPYAGPLLLLGYAATTGRASARARPLVVVAVVAYSAMLASSRSGATVERRCGRTPRRSGAT